jgi:hypothetical protein
MTERVRIDVWQRVPLAESVIITDGTFIALTRGIFSRLSPKA